MERSPKTELILPLLRLKTLLILDGRRHFKRRALFFYPKKARNKPLTKCSNFHRVWRRYLPMLFQFVISTSCTFRGHSRPFYLSWQSPCWSIFWTILSEEGSTDYSPAHAMCSGRNERSLSVATGTYVTTRKAYDVTRVPFLMQSVSLWDRCGDCYRKAHIIMLVIGHFPCPNWMPKGDW